MPDLTKIAVIQKTIPVYTASLLLSTLLLNVKFLNRFQRASEITTQAQDVVVGARWR
jgi:hypothetical protein